MRNKALKINLISLLMITLIVLTVGFTTFGSNLPIDPGPGEEEGGGDIIDPDPEVPDPDVEIPKYAIPLIQFGVDFLDNCKGYKSKFVQTTDTTELSIPVSINIRQMIKSYSYRSGDNVLIETYTDCNSSMGAFWYRYFYGNSKEVESFKVDKCDYNNEIVDFSQGASQTQTTEDFQKENMNIRKFPFSFNSSNTSLISDRIEGKYRKIKVSFKKDAVSDNYRLQYYGSGLVVPESLDIIKDLEFIFYISRTTGRIAKYEKFETYKVRPTSFPSAVATMASHYIEEFQILDKEVEFTKPGPKEEI